MRELIKLLDGQFLIIILTWLLVGVFGGPVIYAYVPITMLLLRYRERFEELLIGFVIILVLSDSLDPALSFAKDTKNIYILVLAFFFLADFKKFTPSSRIFKIFLPLYLFAFIPLLFAGPNIFMALQKTVSYLLLFIVVPNYTLYCYREYGERFLRRLVYYSMLPLALGLLIYLFGLETVFITGERYRGVFGNPNGLGIFTLLITMLVALLNSKFPELFTRRELIVFFVLIGISTVLSGSRTALFAIGMFFAFTFFFKRSWVLGVLVFFGSIFLYELVSNNIVTIVAALGLGEYLRVDTLEAGSGRFIAWNFAWNQIQDFFWVGGGFSNDEYIMRQHYEQLERMGHQGGVHSSYLTLWFDLGLVGILIYFRSFLLAFVGAIKRSVYSLPILFAVLFSITYESWLAGSLNPFTIFLLVTLTVLNDFDFHKSEGESTEYPPGEKAPQEN